jgi:hypothetical protein
VNGQSSRRADLFLPPCFPFALFQFTRRDDSRVRAVGRGADSTGFTGCVGLHCRVSLAPRGKREKKKEGLSKPVSLSKME